MVPAVQRGKHQLTLCGLESACASEILEIVCNINNHMDKGVGGEASIGRMGVGGGRRGMSVMGEVGRGRRFLRQS